MVHKKYFMESFIRCDCELEGSSFECPKLLIMLLIFIEVMRTVVIKTVFGPTKYHVQVTSNNWYHKFGYARQ